jgi:hypothetical protein
VRRNISRTCCARCRELRRLARLACGEVIASGTFEAFSAVLIMVLIANLCVLKWEPANLTPYYIGLLVMLLFNLAIPLDSFLGLPSFAQAAAVGSLALSPVFFAGLIFCKDFRGGTARTGACLQHRRRHAGRIRRDAFSPHRLPIAGCRRGPVFS